MIALVIVFCHFTEPIDCNILRLVPDSETPIGCLVEGDERAALWLGEHDGWTQVRVICERDVPLQKPA